MFLELAVAMRLGKALVAVLVPADLAHHRSLGLAAHETMFFSTLELLFILVGTAPVVLLRRVFVVRLRGTDTVATPSPCARETRGLSRVIMTTPSWRREDAIDASSS